MDISPQERDRIAQQVNAASIRKQAVDDFIQLCLVWCLSGLATIAVLLIVGLSLYLLGTSS